MSLALDTLVFLVASRRDDDLSLDEVSRLCDSLGPLPGLVLSGGEPLLRDDLYRICRMFLLRNGVRRLDLLTSGGLPERAEGFARDLLTAHPGLRLTVKVALDGVGASHDKSRASPGSFDKAVATLAALKRLQARHGGLGVVASTLITGDNAADLGAIIDFVYGQVRPDAHEFDFARGVPGSPGGAPFDLRTVERLHLAVLANKRRYLDKSGAGAARRWAVLASAAVAQWMQRRCIEGRRPLIRCGAGRTIAVVDSNGDVRACESRPPMGNLRAAGMEFGRLWRSAEAQAQREAIRAERCSCTHVLFLKRSVAGDLRSAWSVAVRMPFALRTLL
ncbi:MAG: radical SAM protein [Elusimicrobia bacterium]|nr:radical SAM protein [Elusimicrobiota bacterium]